MLDSTTSHPLDTALAVTFFATAAADTKAERQLSLRSLAALIKAETGETKEALPWLKLVRFGVVRSAKGSLRHDGNVLAISGIEADYDGECVTVDQACDLLHAAKLAAVVYTSPSHTEAAPRWRVLCPLSADMAPDQRAALVGRLNGVLGGVLSRESFTLSQSYYFGSVNSNPAHRVELVDGDPIDVHSDLPIVGVPAAARTVQQDGPFDWDQRKKPGQPQEQVAEKDIVAALSREGDRSALVFRLTNRLRRANHTPREIVDTLADHADLPVMGHYGEDGDIDEDRVCDDVQRAFTKKNPNERASSDVFKHARLDLTPASAPATDVASTQKRRQVAYAGSIIDMAECFIENYGDRLRFVKAERQWYYFDGTHWRKDETNHVRSKLKFYLGKLSLATPGADSVVRAIASTRTLDQVETATRDDPRITVTADTFDTGKFMLCTPGGMVDLRTGEIRPAKPDDYCRSTASVAPSPPGTPCPPLWGRVLRHFTQGDAGLRDYLQRLAGLCLVGANPEQVLVIVEGPTGSGKSTTFETWRRIMGDYAKAALVETFLEDPRGSRNTNDLAEIAYARMVIAGEPDERQRLSASTIKQVCSGEAIKARALYRQGIEFNPEFTVILTCNAVPHLGRPDPAVQRRLHVIPGGPTVPTTARDPDLPMKLRDEYPAILRWMIDGAVEWHKGGLRPPAAVLRRGQDYFDSQDPLAEWRAERTEYDPAAFTTTADLYHDYTKVRRDQPAMPVEEFGQQLRTLQWETLGKDGQTVVHRLEHAKRHAGRGFVGIKLRSHKASAIPDPEYSDLSDILGEATGDA